MDPTLVILLVVLVLSIVAGPAIGFWFARRRMEARDRERLAHTQRFAALDDDLRAMPNPEARAAAVTSDAGIPRVTEPTHPLGPRRFDFEPPVFGPPPTAGPASTAARQQTSVQPSTANQRPATEVERPAMPETSEAAASDREYRIDESAGPSTQSAGEPLMPATHAAPPADIHPSWTNLETGRPSYRPVSEIVEDATGRPLGWIDRISTGRLMALHRLGYDDAVKIANLRGTEIARLARALEVPEDVIMNEWMPAARQELGIRNPID